jgi:hypothetical protein
VSDILREPLLTPEDARQQLLAICAKVTPPWAFYSRAGEGITFSECAEAFRSMRMRRVAETILHGMRISTVWLGVDHSTGQLHTRPAVAIFETMVFRGARGSLSWAGERYSTEFAAYAGHARMCQVVKQANS